MAVAEAPAEQKKAYEPPKSIHGFELVRDQFVAEYDSQVLTYRHKKTGEARDAALLAWCGMFSQSAVPLCMW